MAIQKKASSLFTNTGKGAIATAEPVENTGAYEGVPEEREPQEVSSTKVTKVTARIPLYQYAFLEVDVEGEGAIEEAIRLTKVYGEQALQKTGGVAEPSSSGDEFLEKGKPVLFAGEEVVIPEEFVEELEGAKLTDNRGMGLTKTGKKRPDFVWSNGVNQLAGYINTTDFKGNKLAQPKLSWAKAVTPAYQPRG